MSKSQCNYHTSKPSIWQCLDCTRDFCGDCVVSIAPRVGAPSLPKCALCAAPLNYLGGGNEAKPFWSMAHVFFTFPLKGPGIAALGFLAFVGLFFGFGLIGLLALIFSLAVILKYGLATLEAVADGQQEPPSINDAIQQDEDNLFLRFVGMMMILGFSTAVVTILIGETAGAVFSILLSLLSPAMFVFLAIDRQISSALNPAKLVGLAFTIGPPYLLVVLLSNVISTGPFFVLALLGESFANSFLAGPITAAVLGYFAIVYFALLGYVLYENQAELGYVAGDPEDQVVAETLDNQRREVLGQSHVLFKEQRDADGFKRLMEAPTELRSDPIFAERFFNLAVEKRDPDALAVATDLHLERLCDKQAYDLALDGWRKARDVAAEYLPARPEWRHHLAEAALQRNLPKEAFTLLVNLHKPHPDYAELPSAYQLLSNLLKEQGRDEDAGRILRFLEQHAAKRLRTKREPSEPESKPEVAAKDSDSSSWKLQD